MSRDLGASPDALFPSGEDVRPARQRRAAYLLLYEQETIRLVPLPADGELTFGHGAAADVQLHDPELLPLHARLVVQDGELTLHGLAGANGILVDGEPLDAPRPLVSGATIS